MTVTTTEETTLATPADEVDAAPTTAPQDLVEADLLVEDVSIDGMCGVY